MAKSARPQLSPEVRAKKETELARLRKMQASLPPDRKTASRQIGERVNELEVALGLVRGRSGGVGKMALIAVVAVVALAVSFVGVIAAGHFLAP